VIEEENLTIDLHQEFAAVEVRYRMRNTGPKVVQDFFFPVERWALAEEGADGESGKPADRDDFQITTDKTELKWKDVDLPVPAKTKAEPAAEETPEPTPETEATAEEESDGRPTIEPYQGWWDFPPPTKHWKKSEIPFAANQTREVVVRYRVAYSGQERSVSDDGVRDPEVTAANIRFAHQTYTPARQTVECEETHASHTW